MAFLRVVLTTAVVGCFFACAAPTHPYAKFPGEKPAISAFEVVEDVTALEDCYAQCDALPCAGFTLLKVDGAFLCAYYHNSTGLAPSTTDKYLVAYYKKGAPGPAPAPGPPLPPAPPPRPQPHRRRVHPTRSCARSSLT